MANIGDNSVDMWIKDIRISRPLCGIKPYLCFLVTYFNVSREMRLCYNSACMGSNGESRQSVGRMGEEIASQFLVRRGFKILERNFRKPWGEIDIIAEKRNTIRFVEVKTVSRETLPDVSRESDNYRPEEQVHPWKLRKIARTAEMYMNATDSKKEYQIDVVGVFLDIRTRTARCRLYENVN